MEKRRAALRFALAAAGLASFSSWACTPALEGTRLESERFVLAYKALPKVGAFFAVDVAACAKAGSPAPETLKVDAHMPDHRHGMNYVPKVAALGAGRWRAEGLMLHMPGRWEFVFELRAAGKTDRLANRFSLSESIQFSESEKAQILSLGPWPPPLKPDPTNRVSGKREAIAFGEKLFFEPRLSGTGSVLCATCHAPFRAFQDGKPRAFGLEEVDRNTPSLLNVRFTRWYGWDGAQDSLWSQSMRPLLDPREMRATPEHVLKVVRQVFPADYQKVFGEKPQHSERVLVNVGKALAAYQETLVSGRTPFDDFRDSLENNQATDYVIAAQRGLKIFVGKGNCTACHFGPQLTNGEFADIGVKFFVSPGRVDPGRLEGIKKVKSSPFNLLGRHNDDRSRKSAIATRHVEPQHRNFGEFRVPSLRNVALTAPYMHNGSVATLREVVRFYSELNEERLHADGEKILRPLKLSDQESEDLVAFLESLTEKK